MLKIAKYATRKARILMERIQGLDFSSVIQPEQLGLDSNTYWLNSH